MKKELDEQLVREFPNLYADRNADMRTTAMCWGFDCGDGWFQLIYDLSAKLEKIITDYYDMLREKFPELNIPADNAEVQPRICASQVKEKYGTLRFYMTGYVDGMDEAIAEAEDASAVTCEECGEPGVLRGGGWIKCLCDEHADGREKW